MSSHGKRGKKGKGSSKSEHMMAGMPLKHMPKKKMPMGKGKH